MSVKTKARAVQKATGLPYSSALRLVTGMRQVLPKAPDCLIRDALDDIYALGILKRWSKTYNRELAEPVQQPDGTFRLQLSQELDATGQTPARARYNVATEVLRIDPSLAPQIGLPTPEERVPCNCPRCDPDD